MAIIFTNSSDYMKNHFRDYSMFVKKFINPVKIVEIGSNDSTFLKISLMIKIKSLI